MPRLRDRVAVGVGVAVTVAVGDVVGLGLTVGVGVGVGMSVGTGVGVGDVVGVGATVPPTRHLGPPACSAAQSLGAGRTRWTPHAPTCVNGLRTSPYQKSPTVLLQPPDEPEIHAS